MWFLFKFQCYCKSHAMLYKIDNVTVNEPILSNSFDFLLIGASDCVASDASWLSRTWTSLNGIRVAAVICIFDCMQAVLNVQQRLSCGWLTIEAFSTRVHFDYLCGISKRYYFWVMNDRVSLNIDVYLEANIKHCSSGEGNRWSSGASLSPSDLRPLLLITEMSSVQS